MNDEQLQRVRRGNVSLLIKKAGSQAKLAKKTDMTANYLSQLVTKRRPVGEKTARKMEETSNLPRYWLDIDHSNETLATTSEENEAAYTPATPLLDEYTLENAPVCQSDYKIKLKGNMLPEYPKPATFLCVPFDEDAKKHALYVLFRSPGMKEPVICEQLGSTEQKTLLLQLVAGRRVDHSDLYYTYGDGEILCAIHDVISDSALRFG